MDTPSVEIETGPEPRHSVIWLHGLGADGHDFEPIVPELVDPAWPPIRFVFPHAPMRAVTINNGMEMRAWYDIGGFDLGQRQDEPGIRASIKILDELIAREWTRGVPTENMILAGFSQGGAIALAGGLRHARRLGGIVALSTYLPMVTSIDAERSPANANLPIFIAHGTMDPVVPQPLGLRTRDTLLKLGYAVEWHAYPMAHQVSQNEISDLRRWLGARFSAAA